MYAHLHTHTIHTDEEIEIKSQIHRHGAFVYGGISQLNFYPAIGLRGPLKTSKCFRTHPMGPWSWEQQWLQVPLGSRLSGSTGWSLRLTPICLLQIPAEVWPLYPLCVLPVLEHKDSAPFGSILQLPARPRQHKE